MTNRSRLFLRGACSLALSLLPLVFFACSQGTGTSPQGFDGSAATDASGSGTDGGAAADSGIRSAEGRYLFARHFGGAGNEDTHAIATDPAGNIIIAGAFWGSIDFGQGPIVSVGSYDSFVAKLRSDGSVIWSRTFGGTEEDYAWSTTLDQAGNIIVIGRFSGQVDFGSGPLIGTSSATLFVAKYAADGKPLWAHAYGDTNGSVRPWSVAVDPSDNIILSGSLSGRVDLGGGVLTSAGSTDAVLFKLTPAGDHVFSKRFGSSSSDTAFGVKADPSGEIVVVGAVVGAVDFGGGPLAAATTEQAFVARFGGDGSYRWARRLGPSGGVSHGTDVVIASNGELVTIGNFLGTVDCGGVPLQSPSVSYPALYLARYSSSGLPLGSQAFAGSDSLAPTALVIDSRGNLLIGGAFFGSLSFGGGLLVSAGTEDAFLVKLTAAGQHLWSRRYGSDNSDQVNALAVDRDDNVLAGGISYGAVDFGGGPLPSATSSPDDFLVKLSP